MDVDLIRFDEIGRDGYARLVLPRFGADTHAGNVIERADDPLRPEEPERELEVVPRCPHHDREGLPIEGELERLFRGDLIAIVTPVACAPARDLDRWSLRTRHGSMLGGR